MNILSIPTELMRSKLVLLRLDPVSNRNRTSTHIQLMDQLSSLTAGFCYKLLVIALIYFELGLNQD